MKIVYLTAGAAGMFCGSCMHDNSLARALRQLGADCLLQPLYTPIRTDDESVASQQVFFGGVHIYLLQMFPAFRWVPGPVRRLLDQPRFLSWATRRSASTDAAKLGDLAVSMLRGMHGSQRDEVNRLVDWLRSDVRPDAIIFSNLLIGGCIPRIREELPSAKIVVILQGDDSFLEHLPTKQQATAIDELEILGKRCDSIIVNTEFYAQKMARLLKLPHDRVHVLPLAIDIGPFAGFTPRTVLRSPVTIGYLARVAPEKGFHHLVSAFIDLAKRPGCESVRLCAAGWLGPQNEAYKQTQESRIAEAGLSSRYEYLGSPDLNGKLDMLRRVDLLCVPTEHDEPKGLFLLEAMAAGVPVVQPFSGAFPEIIERTGGGLIIDAPSSNSVAIADGLERLVKNTELRLSLGAAGQRSVRENHNIHSHAKLLLEHINAL
jgi:glycosyltransferase involved in cell wall biosynthesis